MKLLRLLLVLLALLTVGAVATVIVVGERRSSRGLLDDARERLRGPRPDVSGALRDLDLALELAVSEDDKATLRNVLRNRASLFARRGATEDALADYQRILDEIAPNDVDTMLEIGWLSLSSGASERALGIADRILATQPRSAGARFLRGRAHEELAEARMAGVADLLGSALADEPAAAALDLAWRAAILPTSDPLRATALSSLSTSLSGTALLGDVLRHVEHAGKEIRTTLSSFAEALEFYPHEAALAAIVELLVRAGRAQDAADLGVAALSVPRYCRDVAALETLVRTLQELGRDSLASHAIDRARAREAEIPDSFLPRWCAVLYEAERWTALAQIAEQLVNRSRPRSLETRLATGLFYRGMAELRLGNAQRAAASLEDFLRSPTDEPPLPDARVLAWLGVASAQRQLLSPSSERRALQAALAVDPDASAEAWERLAELQEAEGEPLAVVAGSLTRAVELAPERAEELVPRWRDVSERALAAEGKSPELVHDELEREKRAVPVQWLAWELLRIAELWAGNRQWNAADTALDRLLAAHPRLVPAMDLRVDALLERGRHDAARDLLFERISLAGPPPDGLRKLDRIPPDLIAPADFLRLMELDGEGLGLRTVLAELRRADELDYARSVLAHKELSRLQDELQVELAELLLDARDHQPAFQAASAVDEGSPVEPRALVQRVRAALATASRHGPHGAAADSQIALAVERLARLAPTARDAAREAARELALAGRGAAALELLAPLDAAPADAKTRAVQGEVLVQIALAHLLEGDPRSAELAALRAEAFRSDAVPSLVTMQALLDLGRAHDVPRVALELARDGPALSDLAATALLALQERVEEAAGIAAAQVGREGAAPEWHLLLAAANALLPEAVRRAPPVPPPYPEETLLTVEGGIDPRVLLAVLVSAEVEEGAPWALARLRPPAPGANGEEPPAALELWPRWITARTLERLGRAAEAEDELGRLADARPEFAPAWSELVEHARARTHDPLDPAVLRLQHRWLKAAGAEALPPDDLLLLRADAVADAGDLPEALRMLRARAAEPDVPELVLVLLARLERRAREPGAAVDAWTRLLERAERATAARHLPEVLDALAEARAAGDVTGAAYDAHLRAVAAQLPEDPLAAVALAEHTIESSDQPALAVSRAWSDLERFRQRTERLPIAELRRDAVARWFALYERHDPVRAQAFARSELLARPGAVDLWLLDARGLEARGDLEGALARYEALVRIVPDPRALRRAAALLADTGASHARVVAAIQRLREVEGESPRLVAESQLLTARSLVRSGPPLADNGLGLLRTLWQSRTQLAPLGFEVREIGRLYAVALLHRGTEADAELARKVLDELVATEADPLRRDLYAALRHLAGHLPVPDEDEDEGA